MLKNNNLKNFLNCKAISTSLIFFFWLHQQQQKQFGCQFFPKQLRNCPYPRSWLQLAQFELTHYKTNKKFHVSFYLHLDWYKPPLATKVVRVLAFSQTPQKLPIFKSIYHGQKEGSELVDFIAQHVNQVFTSGKSANTCCRFRGHIIGQKKIKCIMPWDNFRKMLWKVVVSKSGPTLHFQSLLHNSNHMFIIDI